MPKLANLARMTTATTGTGTITLGSAVSGYMTFSAAGIVNADIVRYGISDGANSEVGFGTYTSAGTTLSRNVVNSTNSNAPINLSGNAQVFITAIAQDFVSQTCEPPGGRLTLTSGLPVPNATVTGATTVYYTPYRGNYVPIFDGQTFLPMQFSEMSQATTDTTKSPAAVAASKVYDIFVWNDAGTLRATRGPAWTNDTTRGYTLTLQNGLWLNTSAITNGPAALRGTFVGTIRSNASSQIDWQLGSTFNGGFASTLFVWNAYNRVILLGASTDSAPGYSYVSTTVRAADGSNANRVSFVCGLNEDYFVATYQQSLACATAVSGTGLTVGIGYDTTSSITSKQDGIGAINATIIATVTCVMSVQPVVGVHFVQAVEKNSDGTNSNTFNYTSDGVISLSFPM